MLYINCQKLVEACIKTNIINHVSEKDVLIDNDGEIHSPNPEDFNKILVYRGKGINYPEGWYAEEIEDVIYELMEDKEGQNLLIEELQKRGTDIEKEFIELDSIEL